MLANVSFLQFLDAFPTQEGIEQNRRLLPNLHQLIYVLITLFIVHTEHLPI